MKNRILCHRVCCNRIPDVVGLSNGGGCVPNVYSLILAGGSGKRLWPISRTKLPKQMIVIDGVKTLLEKTIDRFSAIDSLPHCACKHQTCVCVWRHRQWVVTTDAYAQDIKALCGDKVEQVIIEPAAKNTAPALLLSCLKLYEQDPDALLVVTPADHVVGQEDRFIATIQEACAYALTHDALVIVGVAVREPLSCYGYIEIEEKPVSMTADRAEHTKEQHAAHEVSESRVHRVKMFHEKPSVAVAQWYVDMPTMLWNCGIVCVRVSVLLEEFKTHAPELYYAMTHHEEPRAESIDDALLEKSQRLFAVVGDFAWSDVGSLEAFIAAADSAHPPKNQINLMGAQGNSVYSHRMYSHKVVVCAGVQDICVIDTPDVLLIMPRSEHQCTVDIVDELTQHGFQEYT